MPAHPTVRSSYWRLLPLLALLLLAACVSATPAPTVDILSLPADPATPAVTPVPIFTPTPPPSPAVTGGVELPQLFADSLGILLQPGSGTWESVQVLPLTPELWAAFTTGFRSFDPLRNHAVAIFTQEDGFWIELGRAELECPDYVDSRSVQQVVLDQASIWLVVDAGTGAHSGCFDLLRWDGAALTIAASGFNSSPGAGEVRDVDGDGQPEVVLNNTDPYVFCYACGVRLFDLSILRWNGTELLPVELTRLPADTVADLREANNRAVELASASLFPAALPLIDEALTYAPNDERVYWNHQLLHALAQGRREYADSTPFPLLNWAFYGDWDAALAELDEYTPAQIFDPQKALLQETAAAGWEETLADWILAFSEPALAAQPDLAPAWFLQGWARFLKDPGDPAVRTDVEQAARLTPTKPLYRASLERLSSRGVSQPTPTALPTAMPASAMPASAIPPPATVETVRFLTGATVHELPVNLGDGAVRGYRLGIGAGQKLYVTASGTARVWLVDGADRPVASIGDGGAIRFDIPATANYTLILQGSGAADILLAIPPLSPPETLPPTSTERVRFATGTTSATLEATLARGAPIGYLLGIGAGQRLWVTATLGDVGFWLLDPEGKTLSPLNRTSRVGEYAIPRTGNYTLVLDGEGPVQIVVEIPPR
ncbi:MAG: hypothetical protein KJZ86_00910 [Caldilineaceae bacterium]|nr:hypothetical protein [Caldilineaceae bacterium]HRJ41223.1 hypothetical protein [Caldilineaceae bacterium]